MLWSVSKAVQKQATQFLYVMTRFLLLSSISLTYIITTAWIIWLLLQTWSKCSEVCVCLGKNCDGSCFRQSSQLIGLEISIQVSLELCYKEKYQNIAIWFRALLYTDLTWKAFVYVKEISSTFKTSPKETYAAL